MSEVAAIEKADAALPIESTNIGVLRLTNTAVWVRIEYRDGQYGDGAGPCDKESDIPCLPAMIS